MLVSVLAWLSQERKTMIWSWPFASLMPWAPSCGGTGTSSLFWSFDVCALHTANWPFVSSGHSGPLISPYNSWKQSLQSKRTRPQHLRMLLRNQHSGRRSACPWSSVSFGCDTGIWPWCHCSGYRGKKQLLCAQNSRVKGGAWISIFPCWTLKHMCCMNQVISHLMGWTRVWLKKPQDASPIPPQGCDLGLMFFIHLSLVLSWWNCFLMLVLPHLSTSAECPQQSLTLLLQTVCKSIEWTLFRFQ